MLELDTKSYFKAHKSIKYVTEDKILGMYR